MDGSRPQGRGDPSSIVVARNQLNPSQAKTHPNVGKVGRPRDRGGRPCSCPWVGTEPPKALTSYSGVANRSSASSDWIVSGSWRTNMPHPEQQVWRGALASARWSG